MKTWFCRICLDISPNQYVVQDLLLQPAGAVPFFHPLWFFIFVFKYLIILFLSNVCVPKFDLDSEVAWRNYVLPTATHKILACHVGMWRTIYSLDPYLQNCCVPNFWCCDFFVLTFMYIYIDGLSFNMDLVLSCMPNPGTSYVLVLLSRSLFN